MQAFLYLKDESGEELIDVIPTRPACNRMKVGTFKIDAHNTKLGERFVKKIMDVALYMKADEIYVTIFPKHEGLIRILQRYGFNEEGKKGNELVQATPNVETPAHYAPTLFLEFDSFVRGGDWKCRAYFVLEKGTLPYIRCKNSDNIWNGRREGLKNN